MIGEIACQINVNGVSDSDSASTGDDTQRYTNYLFLLKLVIINGVFITVCFYHCLWFLLLLVVFIKGDQPFFNNRLVYFLQSHLTPCWIAFAPRQGKWTLSAPWQRQMANGATCLPQKVLRR
jgi:hypothetical protein